MLLPQTERKVPVSCNELCSAIGALREAITDGQLDQIQPLGPAAIYTSSVTLWMLIMQRIQGGLNLDQTVKDFIGDLPDFYSNNKQINEGTLSAECDAYAVTRPNVGSARAYHRRCDALSCGMVRTDASCFRQAGPLDPTYFLRGSPPVAASMTRGCSLDT